MSTEHARIMCVIRVLHLMAKLSAPSRCRSDGWRRLRLSAAAQSGTFKAGPKRRPDVTFEVRRAGSLSDCCPFARRANQKMFRPATTRPRVQNIEKRVARRNEFQQPFQCDLGRPDCAAKIFRFSSSPNQLHLRAIPPHRRGAYASSRYVECGERWTR